VILNKDGSLLAGWRFRGADLDSATPEELAHLSQAVQRALHLLGDSWLAQFDAVRYPSDQFPPESSFPSPVFELIDEERRRQYRRPTLNLETSLVCTVTYLPPSDTQSSFLKFLLGGDHLGTLPWQDLLQSFEHRLLGFEGVLSSAFETQRLDSAALLRHLHTCLTSLTHEVGVPSVPCYLDVLLASADLVGGFEPRIGDLNLSIIGVTGFPTTTTPAQVGRLLSFGFPFRWSNRFIALDPPTAAKHIARFRRNWFQRRFGLRDLLRSAMSESTKDDNSGDRDALRMIEDAQDALAVANADALRFGYHSSTLILADQDPGRLRTNTQEALRALRALGLASQVETLNAVEAFHGSLPGHAYPNVRRPLLTAANCAHVVATTSTWSGSPTSPNPFLPPSSPALLWAATGGSTPYRLNLHSGDVGHTLIVGPTGSGKSALVALLQAQWFRYPEAQVFVFDKGYSSFALALAAGARHFDLAADVLDEHRFSPLRDVHLESERSWLLLWLEQLLVLQGFNVTTHHRASLQRALELLAQGPSRTLTQFLTKVQDQALRQALRPYTLLGPYGASFDAEEEASLAAPYQVFEMSNVLELDDKFVVPLLLLLFHRLEARLDGRPTLIVLEEAWTFLAHSLFADRIQTWLRELRKQNAAVVFVTQALADLESSPLRSVLYESCPTRILLPSPDALTPAGAPVYRGIGLNERQIELVARATRKRDYFVVSPQGRRLIDLTLGPVALAFLGAGSKADLAAIRQLHQLHGPEWPVFWLRARQLPEAAQRFSQLLEGRSSS
jgi:type IV secretion system protein VirB4